MITILHNYVYRGNLYLFKGTFSELVIRALSGLKVVRGPRKSGLTQTYLKQIVPNFVTTLRYTSGLMTREEERNLLLESLNQEILTIPGYTLIPQFMRAVFTEEVVKLSVLTSYKYLDFKENLEKYASNLIRDIS